MAKKHSSLKSTLISSSITFLLCFAMLIGTTFAWFTDSATSGGNIIQTGTLDVNLYKWTGEVTEDRGNAVKIDENSPAAFPTNIDWEPGHTQVVYFSIKNEGTLALKYKVALEVTSVSDESLLDVMSFNVTPDAKFDEVTAWAGNGTYVQPGRTDYINGDNQDVTLTPGSEHFFALSIHMDEDAPNEYMDQEISFDIVVLATQLAAEEDSFDENYDADAEYYDPTAPVEVASFEDLQAAVNAGKKVTLTADITATGNAALVVPENTSATIDLNGYTYTSKDGGSPNWMAIHIKDGATLTVNDSVGTGKIVSSCYGVYVKVGSKFVMNGGTLEVSGNGQYDMAVILYNGEFVMNEGTINAQYAVWSDNYYKNNVAEYADAPVASIKIAEGCVINSTGYADIDVYDALDTVLDVPATLVVYNG